MADRYEIKGRLGRGGIGAVYQAYDHHLGRDVAIKRLLPLDQTKLNDTTDTSLESEAKTLAALQHPNIVTIFEFGEDENGPFVVFELIDGDTLKDLISEGALSENDFYEVADQILDALIAAQKMNILHRDIKPANIMLSWLPSGKFQIKMLDFGLSKFAQEPSTQTLDQQGSFLGSIDYIAPEQIELFPLDQRTDLYSLGCVLYFALTQRPPFSGDSMAETMNNHLAGKAVPLEDMRPDIPIAVCRWVMSLISLHPAERPDDALTAMEQLIEAKQTSNQSLTDTISTAKLIVPVVETAQPTMQPRALEHTRQIITTPAPMNPVVPPHPNSAGDSKMITGRYKPKKPQNTVSRKAIYGLVGSVLALVVVCGFIFAEDRKDRKAHKQEPTLASVPSVSTKPDEVVKPEPPANTPTYIFENSGTPANLPELPSRDTLIAYYSVLGSLQDKEGSKYDINDETGSLGAIENAAPHAHKYHLVKRPDEDEKVPRITNNWAGEKTIRFDPGQKLVAPQRATKAQATSANNYTFAMLVKLPEEASGTLLRAGMLDSKGESHYRAAKLTYYYNNITFTNEITKEKLRTEGLPKQYRAVIFEINSMSNTATIWWKYRNRNSPLEGGESIPVKLNGPLRLQNYEFGNVIVSKSPETRKRLEMPAVAIYTNLLTEADKTQLAIKLFESLRKP